MGVHLDTLGLSYFSVPKCACTTLKQFLFEWENGFAFRPFQVEGDDYSIHRYLPSRKFEHEVKRTRDGNFKIAVLRDTVARIVSCYRNRVAAWNETVARRRAVEFSEAGLPERPSLNEFVADIARYRNASQAVHHHSRPLSFFLGKDASFFDRILNVKQLDVFVEEVSRRTTHVPMLRHLQTGGSNTSVSDLSAENVARIKEIYAEDYDLFGSYFEAA